MTTVTIRLLDTLKGARKLPSDYAIAKLIGSSTSVTSKWRRGEPMGDESAVKLAELASGIDRREMTKGR